MNDLYIAALVKSADDADVFIVGVEYQIAGLSLAPSDIRAVAVLGGGTAAVADDVLATCRIIKHPINI